MESGTGRSITFASRLEVMFLGLFGVSSDVLTYNSGVYLGLTLEENVMCYYRGFGWFIGLLEGFWR